MEPTILVEFVLHKSLSWQDSHHGKPWVPTYFPGHSCLTLVYQRNSVQARMWMKFCGTSAGLPLGMTRTGRTVWPSDSTLISIENYQIYMGPASEDTQPRRFITTRSVFSQIARAWEAGYILKSLRKNGSLATSGTQRVPSFSKVFSLLCSFSLFIVYFG